MVGKLGRPERKSAMNRRRNRMVFVATGGFGHKQAKLVGSTLKNKKGIENDSEGSQP